MTDVLTFPDAAERDAAGIMADLASTPPGIHVFTSAEAAWILAGLRERDDLAAQARRLRYDLEYATEQRDRYREFAREIHEAAGQGVTLTSWIRGRAMGLTPAKARLVQDVIGWIDEWCTRVQAVADDGQVLA